MRNNVLYSLVVLFTITPVTIYAQGGGLQNTRYAFEHANCRIRSSVDLTRNTYAEDTLNRSDCLVIQGIAILASNSYTPGQFITHVDHVNTNDHGFVEFLDPASGRYEQCEYSVNEGQNIAPLILKWLNNELHSERDGITSVKDAIEKVRRDVLKSVFINCSIS